MPIEVASSCEIISRNCSQFLSFLSLCVGRRWWNFENAHKITNKYEQQTIIHHHTYPCTHGCNMLDVATTSARMLGSSENIRDRIQATYNNLYMLSHWRHLKIFEVLLCLSLSLWAEGVHGIRETQERDCSAGRGYVSITCPFLFKSLSFSTLCRQIFNPCISQQYVQACMNKIAGIQQLDWKFLLRQSMSQCIISWVFGAAEELYSARCFAATLWNYMDFLLFF